MKKVIAIFTIISFLIFPLEIFSQKINTYDRIQSVGTIPKDFVTLLSDKYKEDQLLIEKKDSRRSKKTQKQFYLESNFQINEIITSGNVLFNDTITNYLNSIYKNIKKDNPLLQNKNIRFYTSRSTIINAYTTHAGILFVNIGLLAKVKTEDELAFILCHEIAHYIKKHNVKQYEYNEEIDSRRGVYKEAGWETKMFSKANYSRQHETDADEYGCELFKNTKYNIYSALDALANLETYNLPFKSDFKFDKKVFESDIISFPDIGVLPVDTSSEEPITEDNDSLSTHPDIDTRVDAVWTLINNINNKKTVEVSQNKVLKIAQFELCHLYLEKGMNYHALYCALALLYEDNSNEYLKHIVSKSLYVISQQETFLNHHKRTDDVIAFEEASMEYDESMLYSSREIREIEYLFYSMSDKELNVLAINKVWGLIFESEKPLSAMSLRLKGLLEEHLKYYKEDSLSNHRIALLADRDTSFAKLLVTLKDSIETVPEPKKVYKRKKAVKIKNKYVNGIDRLIVISPEYRQFDLRKEKSYKYKASEKALINYQENIKQNSELLDLHCDLLSPTNFDFSDAVLFNDISLLKAFLIENEICPPNAISSKREEIMELTKRYKTDKLSLMGVFSFHLDKPLSGKLGMLLLTAYLLPTLPYGIWYAIVPEFKTINYAITYNLNTEKVLLSNYHSIKMNDGNAVINSPMYFDLMQIKQTAE